jgi:hypothetical protein
VRLVDEQRRLRERGKIRIGYSTLNERGKKIPHKLERFRFTSPDRSAIEQVASVYGGTIEPWAEGDRREWQVFTEASEISVVFITGGVAFSQSREQWQGGHLVRMCDGETSYTPQAKGRMKPEPCVCDLDGEPLCSKTTHLGMILPHVVGLGIWSLVTKGHNAAAELAGSVELIESAFAAGLYRVPARLLIELRERRRIIDDKAVVRKFAVPVLDLDTSIAALGSLPPASLPAREALRAIGGPAEISVGEPTGWRPVDQEALPPAPAAPSFADQLAGVEKDPKPRKNTAPKLPATGLAPRTAAQVADEKVCSACGKAYGDGPLVRNPEVGGSRYVHRDCRPAVETVVETTAPDPAGGRRQDAGRSGSSSEAVGLAEPAPAGAGVTTTSEPEPESETPAKKAPTGFRRGMTANQHKKCFALMAEAFPAWDGSTSTEVDAYRKEAELGIARWAGASADISSRTDIPYGVADPLIKALELVQSGRWVWNGEALFDAVDGNRIVFAEVDW